MAHGATQHRTSAFLIAALGLLGAASGASAQQRVDGWLMNDLAAAQAEAKQTGKPIFVTIRCQA